MTTENQSEFTDHVRQLIADTKICMLTTMTPSGQHVSRPMAVQTSEPDGDLWFFSYEDSDKVAQIQKEPGVNVAFSNDKQGAWVSLSGSAEVVHDRAKAEELWSPVLKAWFSEGLDTEGLTLIRVRGESAEYWDSPSSKVATAVAFVKSIATKDDGQGIGKNQSGKL